MNIKCRKRGKTPKYNEKQRLKVEKLSRKLVNHLKELVIMDDEKYFGFGGDHMPGKRSLLYKQQGKMSRRRSFLWKREISKKNACLDCNF